MGAIEKLSGEHLEAFIETHKTYEDIMPAMLEDARCALLGKRIEETVKSKADVKSGYYQW